MADFLVTYRIKLFTEYTYDVHVGLWLNLARARMQTAYAMLRALKAADAPKLSEDFFDAIASSDEEAAEMTVQVNTKMAVERIKNAGLESMMGGLM